MADAESFPDCVERLFHEALKLQPESRDAFLALACDGDTEARGAVAELLDAAARVDNKPGWNDPAIHNEAREVSLLPEDTALERYRLIERIGAGGMGVVYKALRADEEFSKLVAVKIVQQGAGQPGYSRVLERFRQERQILAGL